MPINTNEDFFLNDVLIIMPAFNEELRLFKTINSLLKYFKNIVLINDGSTDNTSLKAKKFDIVTLNHPINLGQGAALETGFIYFLSNKKYKYAITFDADGQHDPDEALKMLIMAKETKVNAVLGSRFLNKENSKNIPLLKKITLKLAVIYESLFFNINFTDAHNGLRVLEKSIVAEDILPIKNHDMFHATEITQKISKSGKKIKEYPVKISYSSVKSQPTLNAINIVVKSLFQPK